MLQRHEAVVVRFHTATAAIQLRIHRHDGAKQREGLIDEMAAEVIQQSAGFGRIGLLAPAALRYRAPSFEAGLEAQDVTECTIVREAPNGTEVTVPSPILIDGEQRTLLVR